MLGNIKDKALEAQKVTTDAAGSAWEKTVESKDQAGTKVSETSTAVGDKASEIAKSTQESAVAGKDNTGGVLQNTGQTIMNAAQGATETVKNTLGMGGGTTDTTKVAESTKETAVAGKDKTIGVLQSTSDTVVNAAQGATEAVKSSLGMGDGGNVTVTPINNDNSTPTITPINKT